MADFVKIDGSTLWSDYNDTAREALAQNLLDDILPGVLESKYNTLKSLEGHVEGLPSPLMSWQKGSLKKYDVAKPSKIYTTVQ